MIIKSRKLERSNLRHLSVKRAPHGDWVVWWYGAVYRNPRDKTVPLVVIWIRKLLPDGSLSPCLRVDVGITELGLLQLGTIWNDGRCGSQILLEERQISVNFSPGRWRHASQAKSNGQSHPHLIPQDLYPLNHGQRDRSEVLIFDLPGGKELLVPSLEFFSRCYGKSEEVNRILSTYGWTEAEPRLLVPHTEAVPIGVWSVKLPAKISNGDAVFLAHVKYDDYAKRTAKGIYSSLETQYDSPGALAFPQIGPWFVGPAKLIVQGIPLDNDRFLALRIVGGSEPEGPCIWSFRENPGKADEPASEGARQTNWTGGHRTQTSDISALTNITSTDVASHEGDIVEILNPDYRIIGARRTVTPQKRTNAETQPRQPIHNQKSDKHSPGERQEAGGATGVASIHTETKLESQGAARDVWNALRFLQKEFSALIENIGWYGAQADTINFIEGDPCMVSLKPIDPKVQIGESISKRERIYIDDGDQVRVRGVLIAIVKTPTKSAYLFEIERRTDQRVDENGNTYDKEESFCGLIVSPPLDLKPSDWIPKVLEGICAEQGIMARVTRYCPGTQVDYYRRSFSKADKIPGHSTVVVALGKVNINLPHPKTKTEKLITPP